MARSGAVTPFMLPTLSAVLARIWADAATGDLAINTGVTLYRALAGFAIATGAGIALGCAMVRSARIRWFFDPIISVGFPMPKIAFLPIVILWLGFFDTTKIAMVVLDAIFPVVTATLAGLQARRARADLVGPQHGRGRARPGVAGHAAGGTAANPHRAAGRAADVADRGGGGRDGDGRLWARRRHDDGVALRRFRAACSPASWRSARSAICMVKAMALLRRRLLAWHQEAAAASGD